MVASGMEMRHTKVQHRLIDEQDEIHPDAMVEVLLRIAPIPEATLIFCNHATVALALAGTMREKYRYPIGLVTGGMTTSAKAAEIGRFKRGDFPVLIGTAALATGTDGLDKMCDTLIILDDTDDDALRRQLIGRIMPRGADVDASMKQVHRIVLAE